MKKVIILAIALIYVVSIVVVNFFGLEIQIFEGTVYTSDISVESITSFDLSGRGNDWVVKTEELNLGSTDKGRLDNQGRFVYYIPFTPKADGSEYTTDETDLINNPNQAVVKLRILPLDAEQRDVDFEFDESLQDIAVFNAATRTITFLKDEQISVRVSTTDGSGVKTKFFMIQPKKSLHY